MARTYGAAGRMAAAFIHSKLTPLFILGSIALGALAVVALPREEEPQIVVPMVDVFIEMPGATPAEVEQRGDPVVEQGAVLAEAMFSAAGLPRSLDQRVDPSDPRLHFRIEQALADAEGRNDDVDRLELAHDKVEHHGSDRRTGKAGRSRGLRPSPAGFRLDCPG
jgi:hypothetical protein